MKAGLILAALVAALLPLAAPAAQLSTERVVIALKPDKDPELMAQERKSLSAFLSKELGKPVDVIIPLTSAVILEGLANGTIDLGYLSATDMINARKIGAADLLLAGEIKGQPSYRSYWVSLKDKPYTKVEDLRGKPIAFASRTSTSGYVIPMWDLKQKGLIQSANPEEFFGRNQVIYGTGYVSAIERVFSGEAEAAAVSYYVLDEDKHLTSEQRSRLKMVTSQGPVPTHVIAVRASLSTADRALLKSAVEALNAPEHHSLRDRLFTSKLVTVDADTHLGGLRAAIDFLSNAR
jgi:phosphonate transport system substrate-binding protein